MYNEEIILILSYSPSPSYFYCQRYWKDKQGGKDACCKQLHGPLVKMSV